MSSHIGIVGVSPEGAALFYQSLTRHAGRLCAPDQHPRLTVHNEPLAMYIDAIRRDDWMAVGRLLRRSAELLARCGAQFCITPDAAVQHAVQLAEVGSPVPWLTMTELVGAAVAAENRKTVGIIGTDLVMNSSTFQTHLGLKGIHVLTPEHDDARLLDDIIFRELIFGTIRKESRAVVVRIIEHLAQRGCEGVVLACSEAPLLISRDNSPLPVYDAGEILAEACVKRPLSEPAQA